jgi:hypothetical protein
MGNNQREFKGIWIPKEIWEDDNLTMAEKIFLVEINSLDNTEKGCYANNEYFSKFFKVSKNRVSEVINSLVEKGYLKSSIKEGEGNKRMLKTLYNFSGIGSTTKVVEVSNKTGRGSTTLDGEGLQEKGEHNNTINNTSNNTINKPLSADAEPVQVLPFSSNEFKSSWAEWLKYRKEKKQKMPPTTVRKQLKILGARSEIDAIAILEQSMEQGWTGLYEVKNKNNGKHKGTSTGISTQAGGRDYSERL